MRKYKESDLKLMKGFYNSAMMFNDKEQLDYYSSSYQLKSTLELFNDNTWKPIWNNPSILAYILLKRMFL